MNIFYTDEDGTTHDGYILSDDIYVGDQTLTKVIEDIDTGSNIIIESGEIMTSSSEITLSCIPEVGMYYFIPVQNGAPWDTISWGSAGADEFGTLTGTLAVKPGQAAIIKYNGGAGADTGIGAFELVAVFSSNIDKLFTYSATGSSGNIEVDYSDLSDLNVHLGDNTHLYVSDISDVNSISLNGSGPNTTELNYNVLTQLNSSKHTHSNKTVLDSISSTDLSNWDAKVDSSDLPNIKKNPSSTSGDIISGHLTVGSRQSSSTIGTNSFAQGGNITASGTYSHAEGYSTGATAIYSHAEGYSATASGNSSHAEGSNTNASGSSSHAEGNSTTASGIYSHAEGNNTIASGDYSHVGGKYNIEDTNDKYVHIVGNGTSTSNRSNAYTLDWDGNGVFAGDVYIKSGGTTETKLNAANIKKNPSSTSGDIISGHLTVGSRQSGSIGTSSLTVGNYHLASSTYSVALGGTSNKVSGSYGATIGGSTNTVSSSNSAIIGGTENEVSNYNSIILGGTNNTSLGTEWHTAIVGGSGNSTTGRHSTVIGGNSNISSNWCGSVVGGQNNTNSGESSVILGGSYNESTGYGGAVIAGFHNKALYQQVKTGHYAKDGTAGTQSGTTGDAFIIGNGTSSTTSNAFRVTYSGNVYGKATFHSSGADYAEYFEWADGNQHNEDRRGLFVTWGNDGLIQIANNGDEVLGVVSSFPSVVGNAYEDDWQGMYKTDVFGKPLSQIVHYDAEYADIEVPDIDDNGDILGTTHKEHRLIREAYDTEEYILNPNYDPEQAYIPRSERQEWDVIGLMGQLVVVDDGTCNANGFCTVGENGVGTASETGFRVLSRLDDTHIKIFVK